MRKWVCMWLAAALALGCAACAGAEEAERPFDNWYEIFVRSYQDSDGDGIGDLGGVIERLDYIQALNVTGIWLMPVMPSPSYHKYDVTDYMAVDGEYGDGEDMRHLVDACHERGIKVIVDLPVNHTSVEHPWFRAAEKALEAGDEAEEHVEYYHFAREDGGAMVPLGNTGWYYEEQFAGGGMPDLNLDSERVRERIREILAYWLTDMDADGFRLDAVTSYFTGDEEKNIAVLRWLKETCEEIKAGSFLVGEAWTGMEQIARYYESGVDAFFLFPASQAEGSIISSIRSKKPAQAYMKAVDKARSAIGDRLLAPFLGNHDTGRAVGSLQARSDRSKAKFGEGLLAIFGGSSFVYYGEEIGMAGSGDDPNKRLAMYWSDGDMTLQPPGATSVEYPYPSAMEQMEDEGSILTYVRRAEEMRLMFPAIAAGENEWVYSDTHALVMERRWDGECVRVAVNFSGKEEMRAPIESGWEIVYDLEAGEDAARIQGSEIVMPPYCIAVLRKGE